MKTSFKLIVASIAAAYSLRGQVIARAKKEGALLDNGTAVAHSKKNATVRIAETFSVPATFSLTDNEKGALATIRAFESMNRLTGLSMELLKSGAASEDKGAKVAPATSAPATPAKAA